MEWVKLVLVVVLTLILTGAFIYFAFVERNDIFTCCVCILFGIVTSIANIGDKKDDD